MSFFLFLFLALSETSYRQLEVNICSSAVLEKANIKKSKDSSIIIMNNKTLANLDILRGLNKIKQMLDILT